MKLCAAQLAPIPDDVNANLGRHLACVAQAHRLQAKLIVFPELSLTGYEPALAQRLAMQVSDPRLDVLQRASDGSGIDICAGIPERTDAGIRISMVVFQPLRPRWSYSKRFLHADELPFFVPGERQHIIHSNGHELAPAICYESLLPEHAGEAASLGAKVYLASVAKPQRGLDRALPHYAQMARQHGMAVLMANAVGPADNFVCAGRSGAWSSSGERLAQMDERGEGLVVLDVATRQAAVVGLAPGS